MIVKEFPVALGGTGNNVGHFAEAWNLQAANKSPVPVMFTLMPRGSSRQLAPLSLVDLPFDILALIVSYLSQSMRCRLP